MLQTALYKTHKRLGARLIDFGGWEMPVMYSGITEEHVHTRTASSIFDVSHMGRLYFTGPDAEKLLEKVCTRNISKVKVGRCGYSHVCNAQGGILDDVIVSRYEDRLLMVCNAGNREKILAHLKAQSAGMTVDIKDTTMSTIMIAVQGPATMDLFRSHLDKLPIKLDEMKRYGFVTGSYWGVQFSIFRSGYTGEDGLEVVLPSMAGVLIWDRLTADGGTERATVKPAGLGARDTLRLEAGMPLYGHELNENIDPISAGCGWCVDIEGDYIGADAIRAIHKAGPKRTLVGLELDGKRIARQGVEVMCGDNAIGEVTSGTMSPTLGKSIAMAFVDSEQSEPGTTLSVDIRGSRVDANVVKLPFYKRAE
ncbi:MAG: glycine cleavage system aminomethyltransferase GcvT [Phycisphaerales bacterium]|nr:glycine cleavage system aminomethyltransferase GcvT [Phycisphaerales bacterium]MCB9863399.1 glycine cleavage system aminomethyltransferase GcvT [Phycisphaerales bacterium]